MPAADERQLILDVQEGSHDAFRLLVERYMKQAYTVAYGFLRDHDDAEDVAQESFVRVYRSIKTFRGDSEFGTWLYRIVMNLSLNRAQQRKNARLRTEESPEAIENVTNSAGAQEPDVRWHIENALHQLPTLQRATVILRHLNGLSTKQVSGVLGCSEGTVKTHLHRGLKKMKTMLYFLDGEF
jgi:RNA polymerase sigma-70 factor (ECF subfamily)